jgi:hypothetical protein
MLRQLQRYMPDFRSVSLTVLRIDDYSYEATAKLVCGHMNAGYYTGFYGCNNRYFTYSGLLATSHSKKGRIPGAAPESVPAGAFSSTTANAYLGFS